ncbi:diacylglycerol kinase family protein [Corynebacterium breve]|uniref:Diacylglycerol kinase family protein n=1 Tax=Corynebacterium breve TaxID=3049799 RepID=A0ABY8VGM7_9CORY|nr:diacylglycerol kinase family protein [Corynebacterium breve]WIM68799.1 diacylglycerol kinase family protein [Corynebacterium breve]
MNLPISARKAVIVYNPVKVDVGQLEMYAEKYRGSYTQIEWKETTEADPGFSQAKAAVEEGADVVVACGGDGTVRLVASAVAGSSTSLGIVPVGTGNLLARNLKLSLLPEAAMRTALQGTERVIDMCYALVDYPDTSSEEIPFVVMAGIGIDAQMIANTDDRLKKKFGFAAYGVAILKSLRGGNRVKLLRRIDRGRWRTARAHSVIVGNCGELVNNLTLMPDALPDDGRIDVVVMRPKGPVGWVLIFGQIVAQTADKLWSTVKRGRGLRLTPDRDTDGMRYMQGAQFDVIFSHPEVFEVDGDQIGQVTGFSVRVSPSVLNVRIPKG